MLKSIGTVKSDGGAGTILAISILIVFFFFFSAYSLVSTQLLGFTRLQATTNSIALAAADALRGVSTGNQCIVAKDIASNNQLVLERCRIVGFEVFIETNMETLGIVQKARARAGPG